MKDIEKKDKRKIVLSLLIAMAFILPPTAILADGSTEIADAGEFNKQTTKPKPISGNGAIEFIDRSGGPIVPLTGSNGWPVEVDEIMVDSPISEGEYDIEARFCRPEYCEEVPWYLFVKDCIQEGTDISNPWPMQPLDVEVRCDEDTVGIRFSMIGSKIGLAKIRLKGDLGSRLYTTDLGDLSGGTIVYWGANQIPGSTVVRTNAPPLYTVEITIPRDASGAKYWAGCCDDIEWRYYVYNWALPLNENRGGWNADFCDGDMYDATIKKFLEIYKEVDAPPDVVDNLYCTDFEDPCDFYDEWATYDKNPDGVIDTWTWTDRKSNSPDHSFHCTAGDTYLMNQLDILEFNMDGQGLSMKNETDVLYDLVNISWAHWMEGDSIIVDGDRLIQDGGYVQISWTGLPSSWTTVSEVFYDTAGWEDEYVDNITVGGDYLFVRFVFFSDAAFCYKGWYIDDFCVDGIQGEFGEWEFVTDSHSHEQVMDGECIEHTFIESWFAEEGTYKICVWLQTLDDCHYAVHGSGDPYSIIVEVKDCLDYAAMGLTFDPESPAWEGDDVDIFASIYNGGTLDGTDAQVQVTVQYGALETALEDGFDCAVDEVHGWGAPGDDNYFDFWFEDGRPGFEGRSNWHFTELGQPGDCYLANFDETTMEYLDNSLRTTEWVSSPYIFTGADKDLDVTVSFDAAWALPDDPNVHWHIAVMDDSSGYLYYLSDPYDPKINDGPLSNGDGSWVHIEDIPVSSLIQSLCNAGHSSPTDTDLSFMIFMFKDHYTQTSDLDWSGIKLDNFEIIKLAIQEDPILFQETKVIDYLNVSETNITKFTWPDVGVGRFIISQQVMGDDCDLTNNGRLTGYNVVNYREDMEDGDIKFIDHTCTGDGHWQVDDCCGGNFWCGDSETTMYGEEYDDCLYIAPYDEDDGVKNRTQDYGGKNLVFDTWYQINDTTDPANFSGDWAKVEVSKDDGQHWTTIAAYNGISDWINKVIPIASGVNQIRFRFESDNDTIHNRGWMLDNIFIAGIIDDECDSMDNFEISVKCYGNWWQSPDQYHYYGLDWYVPGVYDAEETWWWWEGGTDVIPNFANVIEDPASTFGCFDNSLPFVPCGHYELYPQEINNSLEWTIDMTGMYFGYIQGFTIGDMGINDTATSQYSVDSGSTWTNIEGLTGYGKLRETYVPIGNADLMGSDTLKYRYTVVTDDLVQIHPDATFYAYAYGLCGPGWYPICDVAYGATMNEFTFYGMKDHTAPTTTVTMSGTFDETYNYYTSKVAVSLTAADDISGVAAIYYEVDGVQHTYDGPFTISGDGEHTLCYWSVDNEGNTETKKCVPPFRIDESGPSVTITAPEPGLFLFGNKLLDIEQSIHLFGGVQVAATVTTDDAALKVVEFYMNGVKFAELASGPFEVFCKEKNSGSATFKVVAIDILGESSEASITVDTYIKIL